MRSADELNRSYFRRAYETGCHGWESSEPSPYVARNLAAVGDSGLRLLDLGCGEGRHCLLAVRMGFLAMGVDYEPGAVWRARASARQAGLGDRVGWAAADLYALPFLRDTFDVLVDYGCLHHQRKSDWPRYLAAITGVLRPSGHFLLSVSSTAFGVFGPQKRAWHLAHGAYRRFFTERELHQLFDREFDFLSLEEERQGERGFWHALMRRRPGRSHSS